MLSRVEDVQTLVGLSVELEMNVVYVAHVVDFNLNPCNNNLHN